jgi:hypothetical protein
LWYTPRAAETKGWFYYIPSKPHAMDSFSQLPVEVQVTIVAFTILAAMVVGFGSTALYHKYKREKARSTRVELHI